MSSMRERGSQRQQWGAAVVAVRSLGLRRSLAWSSEMLLTWEGSPP
jgi:hypothetical protein